ncbi:hypothetical protein BHM03_00061514 [Ensete ventricosum]|nr:hypothetical protein BHM03_00061514 [Ensete ventricosum]
MKKLGNGKGGRIHPVPPLGTAPRDHLAAIPAAMLALVAALTAEEKEVLAYLLSGGGGHERGSERRRRRLRPHPPELGCECFCCYKSFWARWDASPNRHVIHRIIDAVEESLETRERQRGGGGRRRKRNGRRGRKIANSAAVAEEDGSLTVDPKGFLASDGEHLGNDDDDGSGDDDEKEGDVDDEEEEEGSNGGVINPNGNGGKSSVRRFMSFIGERVWGVWN